ncbi:unnamed protein product [Camellia sinensis]
MQQRRCSSLSLSCSLLCCLGFGLPLFLSLTADRPSPPLLFRVSPPSISLTHGGTVTLSAPSPSILPHLTADFERAIAKDILAIPVSTAAFESAFSTSGRFVSPHHSRLHPNTKLIMGCRDERYSYYYFIQSTYYYFTFILPWNNFNTEIYILYFLGNSTLELVG